MTTNVDWDARIAALARENEELRARLAQAEDELAHLKSEFNFEGWRGDHLIYGREWDKFNAWQRGYPDRLAQAEEALRKISEVRLPTGNAVGRDELRGCHQARRAMQEIARAYLTKDTA